ncbi:prolactin 2 [Acipenser ruthenus]|uniref:prolactin 2 n=1 Tax=Acipenser ruthenus TaxID=7906 RepID=UPI002741E559|nr:prolactin 2 [Acipenser ruthenus]
MRQVSVLFLVLVCLDLEYRITSAPICAHGDAGCHLLSVSDLFDRVIQHSNRMHSLSSDLHSEFEKYFLPVRNQIGRATRKCHTSRILTPNGKENAQRTDREELTQVILRLLVSWMDPLLQFHQSVAHNEELSNFSRNKALELSDMVHELKNGVEKMAEKMQLLGIISNSLNGLFPAEASLSSSASNEARHMRDYELLRCFQRDSDKVQNYLKILKCRIVPEHGC